MFNKCQKKKNLGNFIVFNFMSVILQLLRQVIILAKKKSIKAKKSLKRMLLLGVTSLVIIIGTIYTIGRYWIEIFDKYQEKNELRVKLTNLKEKQEALQVDANKLQDPDYIARYAREKYSYSKDGEIILRIPQNNFLYCKI